MLVIEQAGKPTRIPNEELNDETDLMPSEAESNLQPIESEGAWLTAEYASFSTGVNKNNHAGPYAFHNGVSVVMCDGSVHFWPEEIDEDVMFALLTREGSELYSSGDW